MKENGQGKFASVLQYIDSHLEESLSLEHLAAAFALSPYHFHRQFSLHCGMPLHRYIQLNRLKRASYRLAFRERGELLDLALETGYESCEAFARAFKKATGQTPGEFRKQPQWQNWYTLGQSLDEVRESYMKWQYSVEQVQIVDFPATSVVVLEHHGRPDKLAQSIRQFIAWRRENKLHPRVSATYNLLYGDPREVEPDDFRLDLCVATAIDPGENDLGLVARTIPAGRCARLRHQGAEATLGQAVRFLYVHWLPDSGERLRDFPLFLQRVSFYPDVPEHEAIVDIFLPLL